RSCFGHCNPRINNEHASALRDQTAIANSSKGGIHSRSNLLNTQIRHFFPFLTKYSNYPGGYDLSTHLPTRIIAVKATSFIHVCRDTCWDLQHTWLLCTARWVQTRNIFRAWRCCHTCLVYSCRFSRQGEYSILLNTLMITM